MDHSTFPPSETSHMISEVLDSDAKSTESNEAIKMDGSPEVTKQSIHSTKELERFKLSDSELAIFNTIQELSKAPSLEDNAIEDSEKRRSILTQSFHQSVLPQKSSMPGGPVTNAVQHSCINGPQLSETTTLPSYKQSQGYPQTVFPQLTPIPQEQRSLPQVANVPSPVMYNMMQHNTMQGLPLSYQAFQRPALVPYAYPPTPFFQQRMQFPATIQQFNQYRAPYVRHTVPAPQPPIYYQMPFDVPPVSPHSHNPLSSNLFSALDDSLQRLGAKASLEGENPVEELKKVKQITEDLKLEFLKLSERLMLYMKPEVPLCQNVEKLKTSKTVKLEEMEQNVNKEIERDKHRNKIKHIQVVKTEVPTDIEIKPSKGTLEPEFQQRGVQSPTTLMQHYQHMYTNPYAAYNPPPANNPAYFHQMQPNIISCPPAVNSMPPPAQPTHHRKEKKMLSIIDPATGKNFMDCYDDSNRDSSRPASLQTSRESSRTLPFGNGQVAVEDSKPRNEITISKSQNETIKLHKSPNPWKPRRFKQNTSDGVDENNEVYRTVQSILNKLTPQNRDALIKQIEDLEINSEERLKKVADLIYQKAINEPKYNSLFAFVCSRLALLKVPLADQEGSVTFRTVLLNKCQEEFQQQGHGVLMRLWKMQLIDHTKGEDKQLTRKFTEDEKKTQRQKLGNIRFISELFKFGVVTDVIVHECILELLTLGDENSVECLCCLLTTVGKELKTRKKSEENNHIMDDFTKIIQHIIRKRKIRPRLRFAFQDVLNLQQSKCQPRQCHGEQTTIEQTDGIVKEDS